MNKKQDLSWCLVTSRCLLIKHILSTFIFKIVRNMTEMQKKTGPSDFAENPKSVILGNPI